MCRLYEMREQAKHHQAFGDASRAWLLAIVGPWRCLELKSEGHSCLKIYLLISRGLIDTVFVSKTLRSHNSGDCNDSS